MAEAFGKKYKLTLGRPGATNTVVIEDLHIEFSVGQTSDSELNTLELRIFNLADETIAKLDKKDLPVSLHAGFSNDPIGLIFRGTKTYSLSYRSGPEIITVISAAEGSKEARESRCNGTLGKQTTLRQVIEEVITQGWPGYSKNLSGDILDNKQFQSGYSFVGSPHCVMEQLTKPFGLEWNNLNTNTINVFPMKNAMRAQAEFVLLSPDTGLIGYPEKHVNDTKKMDEDEETTKEYGIRLKSLLNHRLIAGNAVILRGTGVKADGTKKKISLDGTYKIERVTHMGSFEGDDWITEIEVAAMK